MPDLQHFTAAYNGRYRAFCSRFWLAPESEIQRWHETAAEAHDHADQLNTSAPPAGRGAVTRKPTKRNLGSHWIDGKLVRVWVQSDQILFRELYSRKIRTLSIHQAADIAAETADYQPKRIDTQQVVMPFVDGEGGVQS